jgi:NAD(P)-dependent dehydrogenase (short-subunit alcohol dehydrogenase family)
MARGTVVVTGASSGIGRATALRLARGGFTVLGGVRREEDGAALRDADARIEPVLVDVTDPVEVAALADRVGPGPLAGLVNNAGIAVAGPLEGVPLDAFRRQYEVNVFGLLAVTQALLQSLRAGRGRIVNVGSIGGRLGTPFVGPYSSSKAAVRSLSAALRRELHPWRIAVALVEPGALDTPIWAKGEAGADDVTDALPEHVRSLYARQIEALGAGVRKAASGAESPDAAAEAIEHALTARRPRAIYTVGRDARIQGALHAVLPTRAFDALVQRAMGLPRR